MRALDQTTERMLKGMVFALVFAVGLGVLYAAMTPSKADIERAEAQVLAEGRTEAPRDPNFAWPKVVRWKFVTYLPVPGEVGGYRWRAEGEFAFSLDLDRDRMVNFRLETPGSAEPITLVSPAAIFDKKAGMLFSEAATKVTFPWGTVESETMILDLDTVDAIFNEDVVVIRQSAGGALAVAGGGGGGESGANGEISVKPAAKKPLRITADRFEIRSAKDTGIFSGNVVAKDEGGTIWADTMVVEYYSDEEKKADPSRTGMKRVTCTGHVRIDQETEQAKCDRAVYDLEKNTITMTKSETAQVVYRKDDGKDKLQILADKVTFDRSPGGTTNWKGNVQVTDFSDSRESFFGTTVEDSESDDDAETTEDG